MALLWFGGVERYAPGTISSTAHIAAAEFLLPANLANIPLPNTNGIRVRTNAQGMGFNIAMLPNYLDTATTRKWLEIRTQSVTSTLRSARYFELGFFSADIPAKWKVQGTTICFGFRFRLNGLTTASYFHKYLGFAKYTPEQMAASPTFQSASAENKVLPLDVLQMHPLSNNTAEKYIEVRVKYMSNDLCRVKIFVNKDLVHTAEMSYAQGWGVMTGVPRGTQMFSVNAVQSVYYNDLYMGVDEPGDLDPTDLIGPVTVKSLEMEEPVLSGEWTTSDKTGTKTVKDILSAPLIDKRKVMTGDYVISDIGDRPAFFKFKPPVGEKLRIVAFQHDFIAQQPLAYSTSLQYKRSADGNVLEPNGRPVTINVALEPNFSHVGLHAITHAYGGGQITPEYIGNLGLHLNSVQKLVEDDIDPEDEPPPATEE